MLSAVAFHTFRHLFWRGHSRIRDDAAMQRFGIVEVNYIAGKIGAIAEKQVKVSAIPFGVKPFDECIILSFAGFNGKTVDAAVIRRANQLYPLSSGNFKLVVIWRDV